MAKDISIIKAEIRSLAIAKENRSIIALLEQRTTEVSNENRIVVLQ